MSDAVAAIREWANSRAAIYGSRYLRPAFTELDRIDAGGDYAYADFLVETWRAEKQMIQILDGADHDPIAVIKRWSTNNKHLRARTYYNEPLDSASHRYVAARQELDRIASDV